MGDHQELEECVGNMLRNRRQQSGLSIDEISKRTRIRKIFLQALEDERFDLCPGEAYLIGFLRVYAQALGLDGAGVLAAYRLQSVPGAKDGKFPARISARRNVPAAGRRRGSPVLLVTFLLLTLGGLVVASYGWLQTGPVGHPVVKTPQVLLPESKPGEQAVSSSTSGSPSGEEVRPSESGTGLVVNTPTEWPNIPSHGAVVRLEAYGDGSVLAAVDDRQPRRYALVQGAALNWPVHSKFHIVIEQPGVVALWLGGQPLDIGTNLDVQLVAVEGPQ